MVNLRHFLIGKPNGNGSQKPPTNEHRNSQDRPVMSAREPYSATSLSTLDDHLRDSKFSGYDLIHEATENRCRLSDNDIQNLQDACEEGMYLYGSRIKQESAFKAMFKIWTVLHAYLPSAGEVDLHTTIQHPYFSTMQVLAKIVFQFLATRATPGIVAGKVLSLWYSPSSVFDAFDPRKDFNYSAYLVDLEKVLAKLSTFEGIGPITQSLQLWVLRNFMSDIAPAGVVVKVICLYLKFFTHNERNSELNPADCAYYAKLSLVAVFIESMHQLFKQFIRHDPSQKDYEQDFGMFIASMDLPLIHRFAGLCEDNFSRFASSKISLILKVTDVHVKLNVPSEMTIVLLEELQGFKLEYERFYQL